MIQIIYMSSATVEFSPADLHALLEVSRQNNSLCGITGILIYRDGNFLQVLEGEAPDVERVLERITRDVRDRSVRIFLRAYVDAREFGDWSMAFHDVSAGFTKEVEGFNSLLHQSKPFSPDLPARTRVFARIFLR